MTPELGLEICERQGLKAVISGTIATLGGHFVITLQAQGAPGGEVLAREQEEVRTREQVLQALSRATARLRRRLGESLGSVRRFDAPLDLTTSSLGALRSFSLGAEKANQGHLAEAVLFYRRAIEQDPNFAFAYAALAAQYSNNRQPDLAAECAAKAFALRDRVTEYERLRIASYYYVLVTGQVDRAIETLTLWQGLYPREYNARNNLAGEYRVLGQYRAGPRQGPRGPGTQPSAVHSLRQRRPGAGPAEPLRRGPARARRCRQEPDGRECPPPVPLPIGRDGGRR